MTKASLLEVLVTVSVLASIQPVHASGIARMASGVKSAPKIEYIWGRRPTLAPFAHVVFCMRFPGECENRPGPEFVKIDAKSMTILRSINSVVNRSIRPQNDIRNSSSGFGDDWELAPVMGDCEDYAITKRHQLIAQGWPARSLRLAVARTGWGEGHAVLVVKTNEGDLVLDNRTNSIKPFQQSGLRFLKIQSKDNPHVWLEL